LIHRDIAKSVKPAAVAETPEEAKTVTAENGENTNQQQQFNQDQSS
jgi:pyridoxine 5'-phosphate synthase PdxJ